MNRPPSEFIAPDGVKLQDLKARLMERLPLTASAEQQLTHTYLDSFDWRLHQAGMELEEESSTSGRRLTLRDLGSGEVLHSLLVEETPTFVWELPDGGVREHLVPLLDVRVLVPTARVQSRVLTLQLLDGEEKTILRVELELNRFASPNGDREGYLDNRVRLLPVRGYDRPFRQVRQYLEDEMAMLPTDVGLLQAALVLLGRRPGDYSSKLDYRLDPKQRADATAKAIHRGLLDTIDRNIEGTRKNLDPEFLHDLRVATRRTRSALTQIKGVFNDEILEDFKGRLAWLQQITGPTRDMDVYLLGFESYQDSLPASLRPHLEPLKEFLSAHHQSEQEAMVARLDSPEFRKLMNDWRGFLDIPVPEYSSLPNAARPVKRVAGERIWRMYRRVIKEGRAITESSSPEELHELRKSCKKLRYLMEFFESLYPKKQIKTLIKISKVLLDNLGNFQDLEIHAGSIRGFARQMQDEGRASPDTLLAMGALIGGLLERQQQARGHFAETFERFDHPRFRQLFRDLFGPEQEEAAA